MSDAGEKTLLDEVLEANREFLAERPAPRPRSLGAECLLVVTCVDPRLTALLPRVMGVGPEEMFQVRVAGCRVTSIEGDPVRSLVALLLLGRASEIFVVGHTDCAMQRATANDFLEGMRAAGMDRSVLGSRDVREWFGAFASDRSNVIEAAGTIRKSPILPPTAAVHALLVDTETGLLHAVESGYGRSIRSARPVAEAAPADPDPGPGLVPESELAFDPAPPAPPPSPPKRKAPPAQRKPSPPAKPRQTGPFERAEDVLEKLRRRRRK